MIRYLCCAAVLDLKGKSSSHCKSFLRKTYVDVFNAIEEVEARRSNTALLPSISSFSEPFLYLSEKLSGA
jgi:hypothetical protein